MATDGVSAAVMRDLECPVCHEVIQTPKMLPCGHSLCASPCLQQLAGDDNHVKCPECRAAHLVPDGGVNNFPTNFFLCRVLENTKTSVCLDQSCCPGCSADSVTLRRCSHCASHICGVCREEHTDIMKKDLMKQFAECSGNIESAEFDQKEGSAMKRLEDKVTAMHNELEQVTESIYQVINQRKQELYQGIDDFKTVEMDKILAHRQKAKDSYIAFCKEKQMLLDGDVSHSMLIQLEEELFDKIEKFKFEENDVVISDATLLVDKKAIVQSLSKFGEIKDRQQPILEEETKSEVFDVPVIQPVPLDINREFTEVKRCIGRQGTMPGLFDSPSAVQVSPVTENLVVADDNNKRIQIFTSEGEFINAFTKPFDDQQSVKHLEISNKGDIVILSHNGNIAAYNENGQLMHECSVKSAISIGLAPNGDVHVGIVEGGVTVLRQGKIVNSYIIGRDQGRADRICITKSGTVYVLQLTNRKYCLDNQKSSDTMFVLNQNFQLVQKKDVGVIVRKVRCNCCSNHSPQSIQTAPRGSLRIISGKYFLTTDPESHSVTIYDLDWKMIKQIGTQGITVNGLCYPKDAAVTLDGDLVVVSDNHMMQFF